METGKIKHILFEVLSEKRRYSGHQGSGLIKCLFDRYQISDNEIKQFFLCLEEYIGKFDDLPINYQKAFQEFADFYLKEINKFSTPMLKQCSRGALFKLASFSIRVGWLLNRNGDSFAGKHIISLGRTIILICNKVAELLIRWTRFNILYDAPLLLWMMRYAKVDASNFILHYIQKIPVHPYTSPVFRIKNKAIEGCGLIGIDMLPSEGKLYFIEGNFNPGHPKERHLLYEDGDVVCCKMVAYAKEKGYSRICIYPNNFKSPFNEELEIAWKEIGRKNGILIEIIDDPYIGSPFNRVQDRFFDFSCDHTLIVNGRFLWGPLAHLVGMKGELDDKIYAFNQDVNQERQIPIPKRLREAADSILEDNTANFPTIIVKNKYVDQAKGINLFKTDHIHDTINRENLLVYKYVTPDLVYDELSSDSFVHIFRCYLLLTPSGPVYLGSRKDISRTPVPDTLKPGKVDDISPFIANLITGDYSVCPTAKEDAFCKKSVLKIGDLIQKEILLKYDIEFSIDQI